MRARRSASACDFAATASFFEAVRPQVGPIGPRPGATKGNQVFKFSSDGKLADDDREAGGATRIPLAFNDTMLERYSWRIHRAPGRG